MKNILILSVLVLLVTACTTLKDASKQIAPQDSSSVSTATPKQPTEISDACRICTSDQVCIRNQCLAAPVCLQPERWCDHRCRNLNEDNDNCGKCGLKCLGDRVCSRGTCVLSV